MYLRAKVCLFLLSADIMHSRVNVYYLFFSCVYMDLVHIYVCVYPVPVSADILYQSGVSYFSRPGEDPRSHHPSLAMDGNTDTCFISGYHTAAWWRVTFRSEHAIAGLDVYGMLICRFYFSVTPRILSCYMATSSNRNSFLETVKLQSPVHC